MKHIGHSPSSRRTGYGLVAPLLFAAACGTSGPAKPAETPTPPTPTTEDLAVTVPAAAVVGIRFTPEAMGRPGLVNVRPKKALSLVNHRAAYKKSTAALKQQQGQILATQLADAAQKETDTAAETALLTEARAVLTELAGLDSADAVTFKMQGGTEGLAGNWPGVITAYQGLIKKFPKDADRDAGDGSRARRRRPGDRARRTGRACGDNAICRGRARRGAASLLRRG